MRNYRKGSMHLFEIMHLTAVCAY